MVLGAGAYLLWGLFPLYWPHLEPAGALEILAHRVVWSLVAVTVLLLVGRLRPPVDRRTLVRLSAAAVLIAVNWGTFIWAVNHDHVVETSLGYFINPLVTVLLGVFVLGERLRRLQWAALAVAGVAVSVLTVAHGRPPWIALTLAFSFGGYGPLKKQANVGAVSSLFVETAALAPVAVAYLLLLPGGTFTAQGPAHAWLLVLAGPVTAVPLLLFGAAATRIPLSMLGLLQYVTPTMHFLLGVLVFGEAMSAVRLGGFVLVWAALALFTYDAARLAGAARRPASAALT